MINSPFFYWYFHVYYITTEGQQTVHCYYSSYLVVLKVDRKSLEAGSYRFENEKQINTFNMTVSALLSKLSSSLSKDEWAYAADWCGRGA